MGKGFRNIYLVPIYELLPGGSRLLSHQPEWKEDRKKRGGVLRGGTAKTFWETWAWREIGLYKVFSWRGLRGKFGLIPNCLEPQSHRSSSKGTNVWPEGLSE